MSIRGIDAYQPFSMDAVTGSKRARSALSLNAFSQNPQSTDTVTISEGAIAALQASRNEEAGAGPALRTLEEGLSEVDDGTSALGGKCTITVNGKTVDIGANLEAIAQEDFGKFRKLLDKLNSGDPGQLLDGLAEIAGVTPSEMAQAIADMKHEDLAVFASSLSKITDCDLLGLQKSLLAIQQNPLQTIADAEAASKQQ